MTSLIRCASPLLQYWTHWKNYLSKAGLSTLYTSGALDGLSDEAKEELLRKSRVFYFNQCALPWLATALHLLPSGLMGGTYPSPMPNNLK